MTGPGFPGIKSLRFHPVRNDSDRPDGVLGVIRSGEDTAGKTAAVSFFWIFPMSQDVHPCSFVLKSF